MAIFASRYERKLPIDDTEAISCEIATVEEVDGHTVSLLYIENLYQQRKIDNLRRRSRRFVDDADFV